MKSTPSWHSCPSHLIFLLALSLVVGCSGQTSTEGAAGSGSNGGGGSGTVMIPVPGTGGSESAAGTAGMPLSGSAAFDLGCGIDGALPAGTECSTCQITSCASELTTALGSEWKSGAADGPCRAWFDCIQACDCGDQSCYKGCIMHLSEGACQQPALAIDSCVMEQCLSVCSTSSQ